MARACRLVDIRTVQRSLSARPQLRRRDAAEGTELAVSFVGPSDSECRR